MIRAVLERQRTGDTGTFGILRLPGFQCFTAELPWRDNHRKVSCIPSGTYRVQIRQSPRFGRIYEVRDIPGRSFVLIHSGNFAGDVSKGWASHVEGCILLGAKHGKLQNKHGAMQDAVLVSKTTVGYLMRKLSYGPFLLDVVDVPTKRGEIDA